MSSHIHAHTPRQYLVATEQQTYSFPYLSYVWYSSNFGVSWANYSSSNSWGKITGSDTLATLIASRSSSLVVSNNVAQSWNTTSGASFASYTGIAASRDGSYAVACAFGGNIVTSVDGGYRWTTQQPIRSWAGVATSANGTFIVAIVSDGDVFIGQHGDNVTIPPWRFGPLSVESEPAASNGTLTLVYIGHILDNLVST